MNFAIEDRPLGGCCGIVAAGGFSAPVRLSNGWEQRPTRNDVEKRFYGLEQFQHYHSRSCALISLSEEQRMELEIAKEKGFEVIHSFYNPNSGNRVDILAKTRWSTYEEYLEYNADRDREEE